MLSKTPADALATRFSIDPHTLDALAVCDGYEAAVRDGESMPTPDVIPAQILERGFDHAYAYRVIDALHSMAIAELMEERLSWSLHVGRAQEIYARAVKRAFDRSHLS